MTNIITILKEKTHSKRGEDLIELLNDWGEKTGERFVRKHGVLPPSNKYFAVVEVWVRLSRSKLLLVQRHPNKDFGNQWECPGGTVRITETPSIAVRRELFEETGIRAPKRKLVPLGVTKHNNWFCHSFLLDLDEPDVKIKLQERETVAYKFVGVDETEEFIGNLTEGHRETFLKYRGRIASVD